MIELKTFIYHGSNNHPPPRKKELCLKETLPTNGRTHLPTHTGTEDNLLDDLHLTNELQIGGESIAIVPRHKE